MEAPPPLQLPTHRGNDVMFAQEQLGGEQEKPLFAPHFLLKSTLPTIFANMLRGQFLHF